MPEAVAGPVGPLGDVQQDERLSGCQVGHLLPFPVPRQGVRVGPRLVRVRSADIDALIAGRVPQ
jgi:hypothetical protein